MRELNCDVAVIGAGTAGLNAYKAAVARGANVLLIERGDGGSTCTRIGCMPSKLLIAAGRSALQARGAGRFGIVVPDVRVDGAAVLARLRRERDRFVASVLDDYHDIPAERRVRGDARFVGPTALAVGDDVRIAAEAIVIAVGARPVVPPAFRDLGDLIHTHETIFEIERLPARLAVLGAGPLGLELAQAFARLGVAVTVLDESEVAGHLADPRAHDAAFTALTREFAIHLGVAATAERDGGGAIVRWTGASEGEIRVDHVLVATGRAPDLAGLGLKATGLSLDDHGTPLFDPHTHRCGDSAIYLAGDAGAWRPVLHEAARGGRIAGAGAAGGNDPPHMLPAFAIAFTEPNLVTVGSGFGDLPADARISDAMVADNGRARIDGEADGLVRLYADAGGRLIGATIVATGGEHLGHLMALAIDRGMTAAELADQPWYHPVLEEMLQQAARDI